MKVYAFLYNPMTEESGYITMSLHTTKEGAHAALEVHRKKEHDDWNRLYNNGSDDDGEPYEFGTFERWEVQEVEIQEP